jgi:hypothetical protein
VRIRHSAFNINDLAWPRPALRPPRAYGAWGSWTVLHATPMTLHSGPMLLATAGDIRPILPPTQSECVELITLIAQSPSAAIASDLLAGGLGAYLA